MWEVTLKVHDAKTALELIERQLLKEAPFTNGASVDWSAVRIRGSIERMHTEL